MLPLADASRRELRIRCVVRPDRSKALLLDRLDLKLPERLRIPEMVEMATLDIKSLIYLYLRWQSVEVGLEAMQAQDKMTDHLKYLLKEARIPRH